MPAAAERQRPRVLMTADAVGGVWTYALDLADGLARAGVDTALAVFGPAPSADQAQAAVAVGAELIETGLPLDWTAREPAELLDAGAALRDLARRLDVDLIHLNSPALAAGGGFPAPVVGVCHSCLATWWAAVKDGRMPHDFRWRTRLQWRGLIACDALTAPTRAFAEDTALAYEIPRPAVAYNGRRPMAVAAARREPMVFTSGRLWDEGKNVAVLDRAAGLLGVPLQAAGPLQGPAGGSVELAHARALGRLPPGDLGRWLARAPVFASAALYEPFGLGVLEAAQAGCALVLSDIATFHELWDGAATFCDPQDPQAFATAIDALLAEPAEAERLGRDAQRRAERYTVEAMTAAMLGVYGDLRRDLFPQPEVAAA